MLDVLCHVLFTVGCQLLHFEKQYVLAEDDVDYDLCWEKVSAKEQYRSTIWEVPGFCLRYIKTDFMHIVC